MNKYTKKWLVDGLQKNVTEQNDELRKVMAQIEELKTKAHILNNSLLTLNSMIREVREIKTTENT